MTSGERGRSPERLPARAGWRTGLPVSIAALLHLVIVASIAAQPLDVNTRPSGDRSLVWRLFNDAVHRKGPGGDFFAVYHAGVKVSRGESPYGTAEDPLRTPYYYAFRYLPGTAAAFGALFARLPPRTAYIAWIAVLECVLAGVIVLVWRRAPATWLAVFGAVALLLSTPYFLELHMGQFTFAAVACTAAALVLVEADSPLRARSTWLAAGAFAAAAQLKIFPLVTLPALARRRAGWICAAVAAVVLVLLNLPGFAGTPGMFRAFLDANFAKPAAGGFDSGNHGLFYLIVLAGRDLGLAWTPERWYALARLWQIVVLAPTVGIVLASRHPFRVTLGGGLLIVAHMLTYIHVWEHHASGALVAALVMLMALARPEGGEAGAAGTSRTVLLAATAVVLLALPTPFALFDRALDARVFDPSIDWPAAARYLMPSCKAAPLLTLFVLGWRALARATSIRPA